jgi:spore maturation protein SpmA
VKEIKKLNTQAKTTTFVNKCLLLVVVPSSAISLLLKLSVRMIRTRASFEQYEGCRSNYHPC